MRRIDTSMKVLVRSFVRWSWLLVLCVVAGILLGRVLTNVIPPTYAAITYIQLSAPAHATAAQIIQPVGVYSLAVTSDPVLNPVLAIHKNLDRQTFTTKQLLVTPDTPSQSIQVQVTLPDKLEATNIANELARLLTTQQNAYIKSQYAKEIELASKNVSDKQKVIDQLSHQYAATPSTNTATLTQLADQITQERTAQNQDVSNLQALQTEQALYNSPLSIVRVADVPTRPSSLLGSIPFTPLMVGVLLILGIVTISFIEQGAGRINSAYALQQKTSLPVLGALRWARPMSLRELCESRAPYAEDCRVMMADVLFQAEEAKARVIALTGMKANSGASSIAAQLAALLAQSKRRVLLVDANLYEPSLHQLVKVPNEAGLAMMLEEARKVKASIPGVSGGGAVDIADRIPVDNFIKPTSIPSLYILPAGKTKVNPGDLLSMPEMGQFLRWASRPVDFVIIDSPALSHGDAHVLGALSDQTLVVVDATKDRVKQVVNTKTELANTGVKVAGLIINKLGRWI